jgi:hypothetical protein
MVKWIDEKVLQYYFKERFDKYPVTIDGERKTLTSCEFNDNFDKFPDLKCWIGKQKIDCEVEWLSSRFDHWNHKNYPEFIRNNGFVVVFKRDMVISDLQQIVIDEDDFKKWFKKNSSRLFDESVEEFKRFAKHGRKTTSVWLIYLTQKMEKNFQIGVSKSTWGFVRDALKNRPELLQIKKDDILVVFGPTINSKNNKPIFARMKGKFKQYLEHIKNENYLIQNVYIFKITKGYWHEENNPSGNNHTYSPIWSDESSTNKKYPHRVGFEELLPVSHDVVLKKLNNATNEFLRKSMQGISITEMPHSDFIELIRRLK